MVIRWISKGEFYGTNHFGLSGDWKADRKDIVRYEKAGDGTGEMDWFWGKAKGR